MDWFYEIFEEDSCIVFSHIIREKTKAASKSIFLISDAP